MSDLDLDDIEKQRKATEELRALQILQDQNDLKTILSTPAGRRVLNRILTHCGTDLGTFTPGQADMSAFKEGRRDVGLWLAAELSVHKTLYLTLLSEALYGNSTDSDGDR